jgi:multidrug efflux system outer membrane protein
MGFASRVFQRTLLFASLVALAAGCATVGPDFERPEVETPEAYQRMPPPEDVTVNLRWWELFSDPVLKDLVVRALAYNQDVQIATSRIEQARAALGFTQADQYPAVDISAGASAGNFSGGARQVNDIGTAFIAPPLNWEIDFWGRFRRATESARAELLASEYALRTVQIGLISEVVAAYYRLLDFHQRLEVTFDTLQNRVKGLEIIQQRFYAGIIPEIDVNQATIQKEIAHEAIPLYEREIARTEHALSLLLGSLPAEIRTGAKLNEQPFPPDVPTGLPSALLERRPDIAEAMARLEAQTARIGVAEALRLPAIRLTGAAGLATTDLGSITTEGGVWSIGGSLLGPVIDFGKSRQRVRIEEAATQEALHRYELSVLRAFREVEDALAGIRTYRKQYQAVERRRDAAQRTLELAQDRYDQGITSYLEVLDSDRSLFEVELERSDITQQYFSAYVALYKALGGGWLTPAEEEEAAAAEATSDEKL